MNAITAKNLGKKSEIYRRPLNRVLEWLTLGRANLHKNFWALRDVNVEVKAGQTLGVLGPNGAGKSTLLKLLGGISQPSEGSMELNGRVTGLFELGAGFHPEFTGRDNAIMSCSLLGMSKSETKKKLDEIIEFSEIDDFIDQPVKTYSSGMYMRLGFSVATCIDPDILLVDEALSVGDEYFVGKCTERFEELRKRGKTIILVTHLVKSIRLMCNKAVLLDHGRMLYQGKPDSVADTYLAMVAERSEKRAQSLAMSEGERDVSEADVIDFDEIDILDKDGNKTTLLYPGEPFAIRARYRFNRDVERAIFALDISKENGARISMQSTLMDEVLKKRWQSVDELFSSVQNKKAGQEGVVTCYFDYMPMMEGTFFANFWVAHPQVLGLPNHIGTSRRLYFAVRQPPGEFEAPYYIRAHWEDTGLNE